MAPRVMKSKQAYYSEEALDEAPREDCTAVKGCIYSRFVFLWVGGGVTVLLLKRKKKRKKKTGPCRKTRFI